MNKKVFDTIKALSDNDKKTLSQKGLKTAEEVGELAKAILPFDGAPTTSHKFIDRRKVLEEAVDTVICALSIAYHIGATNDEIEEMLVEKCGKWSLLQNRDKSMSMPIPFESHVTVRTDEVERFKSVCKEINVKPIVIDLKNQNGTTIFQDVMTSSKLVGGNREAYEHVSKITSQLTKHGFDVIRQKIETVPWHPAAPSRSGPSLMPPNCYFECHFNVKTKESDLESLKLVAVETGSHLSSNIFKKLTEDNVSIMMTTRVYEGPYEDFLAEINEIKEALKRRGFQTEKEIIEFAIYDTRISHDARWLKGEALAPGEADGEGEGGEV